MTRVVCFFAILVSAALSFAGCAVEGETFEPGMDARSEASDEVSEIAPGLLEPLSGPMSGYFPLQIRLEDLGLKFDDVASVRVGGVPAIFLQSGAGGVLQVTLQGSPREGEAEVELIVDGESIVLEEIFEYLPPMDPVFERVVAFGASLTQGVQRGTPSNHGALMGPASQLARQFGAYFPLPLLVSDLFPQLEPENIGPPPECTVASILDIATAGTSAILPKIQNPDTGAVDFSMARADPHIEVHNVSVGGSNLRDLIDGPSLTDIPVNFLTHLVYEPFGEFLKPIVETQLDRVDALKPTLVVSTDLYGNDLIAPFVNAEIIDVTLATPLEELQPDIVRVVERLAATDAHIFIANLPAPSLLPVTQEKKRQMLAAAVEGLDDPDEVQAILDERSAEIDGQIAQIDAMAVACNAHLKEQIERFPRVYLVDLEVATKVLVGAELSVGDQILSSRKFGGLLGLDGVHFSDTGYALIGNLFINAINKELGLEVPDIDLGVVLAQDRESPKSLAEQGINGELCD